MAKSILFYVPHKPHLILHEIFVSKQTEVLTIVSIVVGDNTELKCHLIVAIVAIVAILFMVI